MIAREPVGQDSVEPETNMLEMGWRVCGSAKRRPTKNRRTCEKAGPIRPATPERAVTIIELLVVMMIIFILAALILATSSYVQNKGARSRAETEIAALSAALESYKADNGIYPFTAQTNSLTSATTDPTSYKTASLDFYKLISGDGDANGATDTGQKSYFTFKPQMLGGTRDANGNITAVQYVRDPFGNSYGYSTSKNPMANPTGYASAVGNNPTFDLWSTGGSVTSDTSKWIKNW